MIKKQYALIFAPCLLFIQAHAADIQGLEELIAFSTNMQKRQFPVLVTVSDAADSETQAILDTLQPEFSSIIDFVNLDNVADSAITRALARTTPTFHFIKKGIPLIPMIEGPLTEDELRNFLITYKQESDRIDQQSNAILEQLMESPKPVLLYITASWCSPCQKIKPVVQEIFAEYEDDIAGIMLDYDAQRTVASTLDVSAVPCFIFMKDGKELYRFVGGTSAEVFRTLISLFSSDILPSQEELDTLVETGRQELIETNNQ